MNATDAADATVHDYPGGSESLAPRIGMSAAVLRNKVNPCNDRNHLTLAEADRLMSVTGDHRILQALAADHGYTLQCIEEAGQGESIVGQVLALGIAGGEFSRTIHDALADGIISDNEMNDIANAGHVTQTVLIALIQKLREANASGRRAAAA